MAYTFEDPAYVQWFLNQLDIGQEFTVIFLTQGGEQRKYTGTLDNSAKRSESVAMLTSDGYKRFSVNRVLYIGNE
jgi:hypothetical protein